MSPVSASLNISSALILFCFQKSGSRYGISSALGCFMALPAVQLVTKALNHINKALWDCAMKMKARSELPPLISILNS